MKEILKEALSVFLVLGALYMAGYMIELGRKAARKSLRVCDNCFETIKRIKDV